MKNKNNAQIGTLIRRFQRFRREALTNEKRQAKTGYYNCAIQSRERAVTLLNVINALKSEAKLHLREVKRLIRVRTSQRTTHDKPFLCQSDIVTTRSSVPIPVPPHTFERVTAK